MTTEKASVVAQAVAPLRGLAINKASVAAAAFVEKIARKLADHDMDLRTAFPYPRDCYAPEYAAQKALYQAAGAMTRVDHDRAGLRTMNSPLFVMRDGAAEARFIAGAEDQAAAYYDSWVAKLERKVGAGVASAELIGDALWESSTLRVTFDDGRVESWKTQMIVNVSKLGKLFNQWPTRKAR